MYLGGPCIRTAGKALSASSRLSRVPFGSGTTEVGGKKIFRALHWSSEQNPHSRSQPVVAKSGAGGNGVGRGTDTWKGLPALAAPRLSGENPEPPAQTAPAPSPLPVERPGLEEGREGSARA